MAGNSDLMMQTDRDSYLLCTFFGNFVDKVADLSR